MGCQRNASAGVPAPRAVFGVLQSCSAICCRHGTTGNDSMPTGHKTAEGIRCTNSLPRRNQWRRALHGDLWYLLQESQSGRNPT